MDNICGAICRMVEGNQDAVPLDQVRDYNTEDINQELSLPNQKVESEMY